LVIPVRRPSAETDSAGPQQHPGFVGWTVAALRDLFPTVEPSRRRRRLSPSVAIILQVVAVAVGSVVILLRVAGIPAWDGIYAEDYGVFFPQALEHPWHLLTPDGGYIELLPRLIAQFVTYLPLPYAAHAFALIGAIISCLSALFIFHASAALIRSPWLRGVLAVSLLLLPVAPIEIVDSGVGSPWYLLIALFFATLWRPKSRTGMAVVAILAFMTAASTILSVVLVPLLVARAIALPRIREHAVTAGWAAGTLLQVPYVLQSLSHKGSRGSRFAPFHQVVAFYGHDVLLPAFGWHLSWWLKSSVGVDGGMLLVGGLLVVVFTWAMITQDRRVRMFIGTALLIGFVETVVAGTLTWWVSGNAVTHNFEPGSRYTDLPILLIDAALICAVDAYLRRTPVEMRGIAAVTALIAVLASGWVVDFRYVGNRSNSTKWEPVAAASLAACQNHPDGVVTWHTGGGVVYQIPCDRLTR
jgi:hypothetical protein